MSTNTHDEQLLKKLTAAISANPRGTTQALAEAVGISRATFNRFRGSRENLMEMINSQAEKTLQEVINVAQETCEDYTSALSMMIKTHLENKEYLVFSCITQSSLENLYYDKYLSALDDFFLNGQKSGVFKLDYPNQMLSELFVSMICGMIDAENRGRVASSRIENKIMLFFLNGASEIKQ